MIVVKVTYTVKQDFTGENKKNIGTFLKDFKKLDSSLFTYNVYVKEDGRTFVHFSTYKNKDVQTEVLNVESFKQFQQRRDESGLEGTPVIEVLQYIGGTSEIAD